MLLAFCAVLLLINAPEQSFMGFDEAIYAVQARGLVESGDWITQAWWDGGLMFDRAMGLTWAVALSQSLFGFGEMASRLPVMLSALAAALLLFEIGRRVLPQGTALLGAAILCVTPIWMQAAKLTTQDVPLVTAELLGIWALLKAEEARRRWAWAGLAGIAFGLGFALKSFMVFPAAAALLPYLVAEHRRHRHLLNPGLYAGIVIGLLPSAAWLALATAEHGEVVPRWFFGKLLFLAGEDFHGAGPAYYLWAMPLNGFPWPLLAVPGAVLPWRSAEVGRKTLLIGFPLALFLLLSAFTTRTWYYALQLYPFLSLLAAVFLVWLARRYGAGRRGAVRWLTLAAALLGALLAVAGSVLAIRPGLLDDPAARTYAAVGLLTGLGFLAPAAVAWRDRNRQAPALWLAGWLLGPAAAIAGLFGTGLWGNYNPDLKAALTSPPVAQALAGGPAHAVVPPSPTIGQTKELLLIRAYMNGALVRASRFAEVPPGGLAWVHEGALADLALPHELAGRAGPWALVRRRG